MSTAMPRIAITLVALALTAASAAAQGGAAPVPVCQSSPVGQELLDLSRAKWRWMVEKKADTLAVLFHDAMFVHMGGAWGRTQEVDVIRSGGIHYKHAAIIGASVELIVPTAILPNRIRLDADADGNEVSNPFLGT